MGTIENESVELSRHIAAIMENPATPAVLYNAIADILTDLNVSSYSSESIAQVLAGAGTRKARGAVK